MAIFSHFYLFFFAFGFWIKSPFGSIRDSWNQLHVSSEHHQWPVSNDQLSFCILDQFEKCFHFYWDFDLVQMFSIIICIWFLAAWRELFLISCFWAMLDNKLRSAIGYFKHTTLKNIETFHLIRNFRLYGCGCTSMHTKQPILFCNQLKSNSHFL